MTRSPIELFWTAKKKVFREGHWHGKGGDGDAEAVYDRLSYSWNDLGNIYQLFFSIFAIKIYSINPIFL